MRKIIYLREDKNQSLKDPTMKYVIDFEKTKRDIIMDLNSRWITPQIEPIIDGVKISWNYKQYNFLGHIFEFEW